MAKRRGRRRRVMDTPEMREHHRRMNRERNLPIDPDGQIVAIETDAVSVAAELARSLAELRERGCTCNPDTRAQFEGDSIDGVPVLHTYFSHDEWCPFLRLIIEGSR